jgi:hypothetical protein
MAARMIQGHASNYLRVRPAFAAAAGSGVESVVVAPRLGFLAGAIPPPDFLAVW